MTMPRATLAETIGDLADELRAIICDLQHGPVDQIERRRNELGEDTRRALAGAVAKSSIQAIICSTTDRKPVSMKGVAQVLWFENPTPTGPTKVSVL